MASFGFNHTKQCSFVFLQSKGPRVADLGSAKKNSHVAGGDVFTLAELIFDVFDGAPRFDAQV